MAVVRTSMNARTLGLAEVRPLPLPGETACAEVDR